VKLKKTPYSISETPLYTELLDGKHCPLQTEEQLLELSKTLEPDDETIATTSTSPGRRNRSASRGRDSSLNCKSISSPSPAAPTQINRRSSTQDVSPLPKSTLVDLAFVTSSMVAHLLTSSVSHRFEQSTANIAVINSALLYASTSVKPYRTLPKKFAQPCVTANCI